MKAKLILQTLTQVKCGWDTIIPKKLSQHYEKWLTELELLKHFQTNRCLKPKNFGKTISTQLHHFSDASEQGYGTASYLRFTNSKGDVHVALVMGKSRVTPLKKITIPRLELTAATLVVRMDRMLKSELKLDLQESIFWTDSQSVLKYIQNQSHRFQTFVANRVAVIQALSSVSQWRFVDSKLNPADDASRGLNIEAFLNSKRWINGPDFLSHNETQWPPIPEILQNSIPSDDPEIGTSSKEVLHGC